MTGLENIDCSDCPKHNGYDCTAHPYQEGCIKDPNNNEWLRSPENPERRIVLSELIYVTDKEMKQVKDEYDLITHYENMDDQDKLIITYLAQRFAESPLIKRKNWIEMDNQF